MDTIFALSTLFGKSAIAIVRISGIEAKKTFQIFGIKKEIIPNKTIFTDIYNNKLEKIDESIAIFFQSPNSFTGEDIVELHVHGSIAVIKEVIKELEQHFRLAEAGEFSKRAFLNEKFNLLEAEGLADLIHSQTKKQLDIAIKQKSGINTNIYNSLRILVITALAQIESLIDFPEDDIPEETILLFQESILKIRNEINTHLKQYQNYTCIQHGIKIAILGQPNTGKSSLFNIISKKDIAIVTPHAGTTRDIIETNLDIDGYLIRFYDTAGIRKTNKEIEKIGIKKAIKIAYEANIVIVTNTNTEETEKFFQFKKEGIETINIITKCDNAKEAEFVTLKHNSTEEIYLKTSSKHNIGINTLINLIKEKIHILYGDIEMPIITNIRHKNAMEKSVNLLNECNILKLPIEIVAENLRTISNTLGCITGSITVDDILDAVFSTFCIGK